MIFFSSQVALLLWEYLAVLSFWLPLSPQLSFWFEGKIPPPKENNSAFTQYYVTFFIITQDTHILPLTKKLTLIFKTLYKIRNIEKKKNPFFFQEFEKNFEIAIFVPDKNSDIFSFFIFFRDFSCLENCLFTFSSNSLGWRRARGFLHLLLQKLNNCLILKKVRENMGKNLLFLQNLLLNGKKLRTFQWDESK